MGGGHDRPKRKTGSFVAGPGARRGRNRGVHRVRGGPVRSRCHGVRAASDRAACEPGGHGRRRRRGR